MRLKDSISNRKLMEYKLHVKSLILDTILKSKKIAIRYIRKYTKVDDHNIMILNFSGKYECNVKWIVNELNRRNLPLKFYWGINHQKAAESDGFPILDSLHLVKRGSLSFYRAISSSRLIIDNGISMVYLGYRKKPSQILIETWHGSLGIKKFSPSSNNDKRWVKKMYREAKMTDYLLSNSRMEDEIYREDYWKETPILRLGHARNDILFIDEPARKKLKREIISAFQLFPDERISEERLDEIHFCLFAPTFRDDKDFSPYQIDYEGLSKALVSRFGGEWVILARLHNRLRRMFDSLNLPEGVVNASSYPDIQELMAVTDCGITDYSSWICEYMNTCRPGFIFAADMQKYQEQDREFFFPLTDLPFPVAENNEQLMENILSFDQEKFVSDCRAFLQDKGCVDDGHASERIADKIEEILFSSEK